MTQNVFYSNGKLLLSAEYLVLDGAKALAVPTVFGQTIKVEYTNQSIVEWNSLDSDGSVWYNAQFSVSEIIENKTKAQDAVTKKLIEILHHAHRLSSVVLQNHKGFKVETKLSFPKNWGLGTSSTLINNIAQWFGVNAFELLDVSFGGSGYDIACAQNNSPIIYEKIKGKPFVTPIAFNPTFKENLFFVYLNQKQNSTNAIASYKNHQHKAIKYMPQINAITAQMQNATSGKEFGKLMQEHEVILSHILESETVKEQLFPDFNGFIKSLGAWGGDFIMVASKENPKEYFKQKGFDTFLTYAEMVKPVQL